MADSVFEQRIINVVAEFFEPCDVIVTRDTSFAELGADSLEIVELIMELEDELDVSIPEEVSLLEFDTVGEVVDCVCRFVETTEISTPEK